MNVKHLVSRFTATVVTLFVALGSQTTLAAGLKCDADVDGDIDNKDLALIAAARNTPATGPDDPRDADSDGLITVTDGRICALRCTLPGCGEPAGNRAPSADAGPDQLVFTGSSVMLDGSGSTDPDGDPLTFRWRFLERPAGSTAALSDPAAARPTFTADQPGRYVAELVVNDGAVDSAPDTVVVNTEERNTDPVANAGPDQPGAFVGIEVTLDGSGSTDVDGDALAFSWAFVSRPTGSTATLAGAGTVSPSFTPDRRGVFVIRLTVNDGRGGTDTDDVVVSTENTDRPPVAVAGPDQSVEPGQNVCLDGSGSFDPDLDPISAYAWSFTTRPAGSAAVLAGAATATPCFTADRRGDFVVQLIVTANTAASVPDTVVVTTNNVRPIAAAGPDQTVTLGDEVTLDGSGSSDANGDALGFNWSFVSRPAGSSATIAGALTPFATFAADVAGPFVLQLIVNDGLLDSLPDTTLITVNTLENRPPSAVNDAASTPAGVSVLIDVLDNDSDPDSDPLTIIEVSTPAGGTTAIEANQIRFTPAAGFSGVTSFTYGISDGRGGTASATVTVTVTSGNRAPVANAGPDQSVYLGDAIAMNGSGSSDPDGDAITYLWTVQSAPPGAAVGFAPSTTVANPALTVSAAGLYVLRLVVNDGALDSAPEDVAITVAALPTLSIDSVSVPEGDSGTTDAVFTVTLSGAIDRVVTVNYATANGTATAGSDYVARSGTLTFPAGSTAAQTITVLVNGDTDIEPNETFFVDLSGPVNATIAVGRGTGTILNDDSPTLRLSPSTLSLTVGQSGSLTVLLPAAAPTGGLAVSLSSSDAEVATVPASVTVNAGATSASISVTAGSKVGSSTITAAATGYTSDTSTVNVSLRSMSVALASPLVGVGRSIGGSVTLAADAPAGGVTVNLASGAPSIATVAPASVFIAAGQRTAVFTVTGVALGGASINATATGYAPASTGVSVSNLVVNIGTVPVLGPGQTASLPISLSTPAVGDVIVSVAMADTSIATVSPATVTIPNGQVLPTVNPQVTGVSLGVTSITASAAGFAPETRPVTVSLTLTFQTTPPTITVTAGTTQNVALSLSAPAVTGGFTVNLSSDDPAVASVPATITFPAGQTLVQVPVTGAGVGSTTIRASAPGVAEVTKPISVISLGSVLVNGATTSAVSVGRDLQENVTVRLQIAPPAPTDITLTVTAGSGVLLSSDPAAAGSTTLVIPAVGDASNRTIYVQGTALGTATVTVTAPGYSSGTLTVNVTPSGFAFFNTSDPGTVDAFAPNLNLRVYGVRLNDAGVFQTWQNTRGGSTFNVPVTSSNPAAGVFVTSPLVFTGNTSFINAVLDPIAAGTTRLAITQPAGFTATTTANTNARVQFDMNVVGSSVFFNGSASATTSIGRDLQQGVTVRLQSAPPSPVDITLSVPTGSGVLLASDPLAAGAETLVLPAVSNTTNRTVYVQSTSFGSTIVRASAPGYSDGTLTVNQTPSGFAFFNTSDPQTVPGTPATYRVYSVQMNNVGAFQSWQETRGGATFNVPVTSSNPAAGVFVTSPLVFTGNTSFINASFSPLASGSTMLSVVQPAGFTATTTANTNARTQFTANVTSGLAVVTLTVPDNTATEAGQTTGSFTLTRSGGNTASALAVRVALSGTATLSTDFSWSPGGSFAGGGIYQFNIPAGQASLTVTVTPTQDNLVEGAETVIVTLSPSAADPPAYGIGAPTSGTISIADDPPVVSLTVTDNTATEAGQTMGAFMLARSGGNLATALPVRVALSGTATVSSDFNWTPGGSFLGGGLYQFNIPASQSSLTVTVTPALDNLAEGPETIGLDLSPSTATPPTYNIGAPNGGTITITDDPPVVTLNVTDATASESPLGTGAFVIARSGGNLAATLTGVRVAFSGTATVSTDFTLSPAFSFLGGGLYSISFSGGVASLPVTLTPVNDAVGEVDETAIFTLSASGTTPPNYNIGTPNSGTITIISDEKPLGSGTGVAPPVVAPSPPPVEAVSAESPAVRAPATPTRSKAELKRQQRIEKARQRAAKKEAKRALKEASRTAGMTQAVVPITSAASGVATVPVQPAASSPPD